MRLVLFLIAMSAVSAPVQWTGNPHYYDLLATTSSWHLANERAQARGGNLTSILSQAEQDFLNSQYGYFEDLWHGLSDVAAPGQMMWSSGEPVLYKNWDLGQPSNGGCLVVQSCEDVVHMNAFPDGGWNNLTNGMLTLRGIAEHDEAPFPEPSSLVLISASIVAFAVTQLRKRRRGLVGRTASTGTQEDSRRCRAIRATLVTLWLFPAGLGCQTPIWGQTILGGTVGETGRKETERRLAHDFDIRTAGGGTQVPFQSTNVLESRSRKLETIKDIYARRGRPLEVKTNSAGLTKSVTGLISPLTEPSVELPEHIARTFVSGNAELFGYRQASAIEMRHASTETVAGLTVLRFLQMVGGIDVFEGLIRVTLNSKGQVVEAGASSIAPFVRVVNSPRLNPESAVRAAFDILHLTAPAKLEGYRDQSDRKTKFVHPGGESLSPITVSMSVFPRNSSEGLLAFRILLEVDAFNWFDLLVDATTGDLLYLHNVWL